jgi:hypothetical protein
MKDVNAKMMAAAQPKGAALVREIFRAGLPWKATMVTLVLSAELNAVSSPVGVCVEFSNCTGMLALGRLSGNLNTVTLDETVRPSTLAPSAEVAIVR